MIIELDENYVLSAACLEEEYDDSPVIDDATNDDHGEEYHCELHVETETESPLITRRRNSRGKKRPLQYPESIEALEYIEKVKSVVLKITDQLEKLNMIEEDELLEIRRLLSANNNNNNGASTTAQNETNDVDDANNNNELINEREDDDDEEEEEVDFHLTSTEKKIVRSFAKSLHSISLHSIVEDDRDDFSSTNSAEVEMKEHEGSFHTKKDMHHLDSDDSSLEIDSSGHTIASKKKLGMTDKMLLYLMDMTGPNGNKKNERPKEEQECNSSSDDNPEVETLDKSWISHTDVAENDLDLSTSAHSFASSSDESHHELLTKNQYDVPRSFSDHVMLAVMGMKSPTSPAKQKVKHDDDCRKALLSTNTTTANKNTTTARRFEGYLPMVLNNKRTISLTDDSGRTEAMTVTNTEDYDDDDYDEGEEESFGAFLSRRCSKKAKEAREARNKSLLDMETMALGTSERNSMMSSKKKLKTINSWEEF